MDPSTCRQKVVRESVEQFSRDIDLGGGVCTSVFQERVLWVEAVVVVTVLKHRGALIDELGRYQGSASEGDGDQAEAVRTAKWAASAMRIDPSSELVVEVWKVCRQEPMVVRDESLVPAPSDMVRLPDFVDSAWSTEEPEARAGAVLIWSSKWAGERESQCEAATCIDG